jgi:cytochrome c5
MRANANANASTWIHCFIVVALLTTALSASGQKEKEKAKPAAGPAPAEATEIAALPEDPAKKLVAERCLLCHSAGLIAQQHKDAAAWGRTVTQMRSWGTPIQDEDQAAIVAYLAKNFGPAPARR